MNTYVLSLMLSSKGRMVSCDGYKQIIAETPWNRSKLLRILLGILILFILGALALALFGIPGKH